MTSDMMTLGEHLGELKRRFKIVFLSFVILLVIFIAAPADPASFLASAQVGAYVPFISFFLARLKLDLLPAGWTLIANRLNEPLEVYLVASLMLALAFNVPIFGYEVVKFVDPALKPEERRLIYPFVISSSSLFTFGAFFGYFFLAKFLFIALGPFIFAVQASAFFDVLDFYFVSFLVIIMTGVAFTIPVYVFLLVRFGVIQRSFFTKNRVIIYFVTFILTAVITPDGGPLLDLILFIPIIAMLELAVFLAARIRSREQQGAGAVAPQSAEEITPKCTFCSTDLPEGTIFCSNCGRANG